MKQDEIIAIAKLAGGREMVSALTHPNGPTTAFKFHLESGTLENFAKLVAAKEREACAKTVEKIETYEKIEKACFKFAAKTIRARGEA